MKDTLFARVPGKVMLAGEYAVLRGGVSILACVDRYCQATLGAHEQDNHLFETIGFRDGEYSFSLNQQARVAGIDQASAAALRLPIAVLEELPPRKPVRLTLDTREFHAQQRKLGLGSSAAASVALAQVLGSFNSDPDIRRGALNAHRNFQGGRGSGADIYAVHKGGVIAFSRSSESARIESLQWPQDLRVAVLQMPSSAATVSHITRFDAWVSSVQDAEHFLAQAKDAAANVAQVWRTGDATAIIDAMQEFTDQIFAIDAASGIGYGSGGHDALRALARASDVLYKPVGAGGGDLGIVMASNSESLKDFVAQAAQHDTIQLDVELGHAKPEYGRRKSQPGAPS